MNVNCPIVSAQLLNYCEGTQTQRSLTSPDVFQLLHFTWINSVSQTLPPGTGRALKQMTCGEKSGTIIKGMMNSGWALWGISTAEGQHIAFREPSLLFFFWSWLSNASLSLILLLSVDTNAIWWTVSCFLSIAHSLHLSIPLFWSDPSIVICFGNITACIGHDVSSFVIHPSPLYYWSSLNS